MTDRDRYAHLACRMCGRLANPLYGGMCVPCLDLQDEMDGMSNADAELINDSRYYL